MLLLKNWKPFRFGWRLVRAVFLLIQLYRTRPSGSARVRCYITYPNLPDVAACHHQSRALLFKWPWRLGPWPSLPGRAGTGTGPSLASRPHWQAGPWPLAGCSDWRKRTGRSSKSKLHTTAQSKLRGQKKEAASSFCPFAPVESFLVEKVSIGKCRCCWDIDRVVTWPLLAQGRIRTRVSRCSAAQLES